MREFFFLFLDRAKKRDSSTLTRSHFFAPFFRNRSTPRPARPTRPARPSRPARAPRQAKSVLSDFLLSRCFGG